MIELALTIWEPWLSAILAGVKPIENRNWSPPAAVVGQVIALHAGTVYDGRGALHLLQYKIWTPPSASETRPGFIVGTARVRGWFRTVGDRHIVSTGGDVNEVAKAMLPWSPWFIGPVAWLLDDVRRLEQPIAHRGRQKLWKLDPLALFELNKQVAA